MKLSKNQTGAVGLVTILAVVVVVLVGAVGWLVYDRQKPNNGGFDSDGAGTPAAYIDSYEECVAAGNPVMESYPEQCSANGKTFINPKQGSANEVDSWLLYSPPGGEYSIRLADGWQLERYEKMASLATLNTENVIYKKGVKAVVTEISSGADGRNGFFLNYATQNLDQIVTDGKRQKSLVTGEGIEIEKYYWVISGYESEGLGPQNGDSQYTYVIRGGSEKAVVVNYSFAPGETDSSGTIEKVLQTLKFN